VATSAKDLALGASWAEAGLDDEDLARAREAALPLAERLGLADELAAYAVHRCRTSVLPAGRPTLLVDDVSDIPFLMNIAGVEEYQHRARVRAGSGDLFAAVTPATPGYEAYCRDRLRLGEPELVAAEPAGGPMQVARACGHGRTLGRIAEVARARGGLRIHPYMGIEAVWEIARRVAHDAAVPVDVVAPPTPITWLANDKALFSELVARVLHGQWVVETKTSADPRELAHVLLDMATRHPRIGLKRTRCASGMGNAHFDAAWFDGRGAGEVEVRVRTFLTDTEWDGREEVLAVAWELTDLSPSTQMWLPPLEEGPPRLDGIYVQILEGAEKVFVGSRPASAVPAPVLRELARGSLLVSAALQALGYVGRCSFDTLVIGDAEGRFQPRFTECNGRWGGTSTPMHLVERLTTGPRPPYRAQDWDHPDLVGAGVDDVLRRVGDDLYDARTGEGTFVFYNVGPLRRSGKLDVIAFGRTQEEAEAAIVERLPRLLGVG